MKALLRFDLEDPDDRREHLRCIKSLDLALCLCDIQSYLRGLRKHFEPESINIEELSTEIQNRFDKYTIDLDELIV